MFGILNYSGFIAASILLNLTPGADTIFILTRSASGGRRQGVLSALGITSGILVHTVLAAFGLSAVLAASAAAFNAVKIAGAAYLIFMGVQAIRKKQSVLSAGEQATTSGWTLYRQGVLTNVLNPKVALFFLALLPQYVSPEMEASPVPFLLLGLTFVATSTVWCLILAQFAALFSRILTGSERTGRITNRVTGCIYIALGLNVLRAKLSD